MPHIASTLSSDQNYTDWDKPEVLANTKVARPSRAIRQILIKGKANVITKNLITPQGVLTSVTDDELEALQRIKQFQDHVARGHLKIIGREAPVGKVVRDMTDRDESAPLSVTKGDFKKGGRAGGVAPKSSSAE